MRQRYLDDRSVAEIAQRTGSTADAVSMRLTRGKAAVARSLASDLREEAQSLGLTLPPARHVDAHARALHAVRAGHAPHADRARARHHRLPVPALRSESLFPGS